VIVERQWEIWARANGHDARAILDIAHGRRIIETLRLVAPERATEDEARRAVDSEAADVVGFWVIRRALALLRGCRQLPGPS
jgi:hypothetical protein